MPVSRETRRRWNAGGLWLGTAREEEGAGRPADLRVILDLTGSAPFGVAPRKQPG